MKSNLELAKKIAEKTSDAYSADRYANWTTVAKKLLDAGYGEDATEAIMRSKWARWAADRRGFAERCPAKALLDYANEATAAQLREIVEGTFPHIRQARLDREAAAANRRKQEELDMENKAAMLRQEKYDAQRVATSIQGAVYTMSGDDSTDAVMALAKSTETITDGFVLTLSNGEKFVVTVTKVRS